LKTKLSLTKNNFLTMKQGIVYTAVGKKKYIDQAQLSAKSAKRFQPEIHVTLVTDMPSEEKLDFIDNVVEIENLNVPGNQKMIYKLLAHLKTPYDYTLALDSDTYILDNISEMFDVLKRFDLAICHGHNRFVRYSRALEYKVALPEIPYAFAEINSGVILYKKTEQTTKFFQDVLSLYKQKQYWSNQTSIREMLWKSDLQFYILPREYNFNRLEDMKRWAKQDFRKARPKIFHYTSLKQKQDLNNIDKIMQPFIERLATSDSPSGLQKLKWRLKMMLLND